MSTDQVLIAAGMGDVSGGGLFAIEGGAVRRIDTISTMGLAFDGTRVARNLRCVPEDGLVGEIVISDGRGIQRYLRLDDAAAVHDVAWDGDDLAVVSTWHNAVRWFGPDGKMLREIRYPGDHDASHLNCITRHDGVWYATVFGPLRAFRAWDTPAREGKGRIVELETGRVVVEGLTSPHTPRRLGDLWLVCNSQEHELAVFDAATGRPVGRVDCGLWTRGIAFTDNAIYVGVCRRRRTAESFGEAEVVVIDPRTWQVVERIPVPAQELYDLLFVSREALAGLERGFDVNPRRTSESRQWESLMELGCDRPRTLFPTGEPLPWSDFHCSIEGTLPNQWVAEEMRELTFRVTNPTQSFFTSAPPAPIFVSFKWLDLDDGSYIDPRRAHRTKLPHTLRPNESTDIAVRIVAPTRLGPVRLRVTLVQEGVTWFDEQDPTAMLEAVVEIVPALPSDEAFRPTFAEAARMVPARPSDRRCGAQARTVYISGNCQARSVGACVHVMNPNLAVRIIPPHIDVASLAGPQDVVLRQRNPRQPWSLRPAAPNDILFPRIYYNAFHPDCVVLESRVHSAMQGYHSALVLYGWRHRLSVEQTVNLFNERVFEALGFFDFGDVTTRLVEEDAAAAQFDLGDAVFEWRRAGCFMHSPNHPKLYVLADIARRVMERAQLEVIVSDPESYLIDPLKADAVWPIYPELGARWRLPGAYAFMPGYDPKTYLAPALFDLEEFVATSFTIYEQLDPAALTMARLDHPLYRDLEHIDATPSRLAVPVVEPVPKPAATSGSPYATLPDEQFWRRAVERVPPSEVDPVASPPYAIERTTRIAAIGSCFAQRVSHALVEAGYGVLAANCGNVYTARQLLQLFDRAFGTFAPDDDAWLRGDGRYVDPFRPQIAPEGFASVDAVRDARAQQLAATRAVFTDADVVVLTLGLTEMWFARADGAVFPLAPGVAGGLADPERYGFHNATAGEIAADLHAFVERLGRVNESAHIVLTVSPQPPIATYEPRHILTAATYTKAALRAAVDEVERAHAHVTYFPGYEIVAGSFSRGMYFDSDLRSVNAGGVDRVMRLFFEHYARPAQRAQAIESLVLDEIRVAVDVLCDEDALDAAG